MVPRDARHRHGHFSDRKLVCRAHVHTTSITSTNPPSLRLFNFAIGLFIPPAFLNIRWRLFIVFGTLCFAAAIQFWFTYPETCGKTIEEIEVLFSDDGPRAWRTKKGSERLHEEVAAVKTKEEARSSIEKDERSVHQETKPGEV
jgi:hypothetical protein